MPPKRAILVLVLAALAAVSPAQSSLFGRRASALDTEPLPDRVRGGEHGQPQGTGRGLRVDQMDPLATASFGLQLLGCLPG